MSDELRAAERRRRQFRSLDQVSPGEWVDGDGAYYDRDGLWALYEAIAEDAIVEHPADDGEAVDAEFLVGLGFVEDKEIVGGRVLVSEFNYATADWCLSAYPGDETDRWIIREAVDRRGIVIADQPTRGHVRALLRALGVTP